MLSSTKFTLTIYFWANYLSLRGTFFFFQERKEEEKQKAEEK